MSTKKVWFFLKMLSDVLTYIHSVLLLIIIQQFWHHFCTEFLHGQIFGDNCPNTVLFMSTWLANIWPINQFQVYLLLCIHHLFLSHHHHHVVLLARISLTLSCHFSLSFIASGRSSGLHLVSSHSCWIYIRAGCRAFAQPYVGVQRSTSLMSSSLLRQQCPGCLVCLTWIVFMMGGRWLYIRCFVGCCRQDLFNIARSILV